MSPSKLLEIQDSCLDSWLLSYLGKSLLSQPSLSTYSWSGPITLSFSPIVDILNHLWNTLKFCKARNYTQCKVWVMFVWVINHVTKDSSREKNMHKIRLILQNPKICCVCGGCEHTKRCAGIFPSAPWQPVSACFCCPGRENSDCWAKAECFGCPAMLPHDLWQNKKAWK